MKKKTYKITVRAADKKTINLNLAADDLQSAIAEAEKQGEVISTRFVDEVTVI